MTGNTKKHGRQFASKREREIQERLSARAKEIGAAAALAENSIPPEEGDIAYTLGPDVIMFSQSPANAAWWRKQENGGGAFVKQVKKQVRERDRNIELLLRAWIGAGRPNWTARDVAKQVPKLAHLASRTLQRYLKAIGKE